MSPTRMLPLLGTGLVSLALVACSSPQPSAAPSAPAPAPKAEPTAGTPTGPGSSAPANAAPKPAEATPAPKAPASNASNESLFGAPVMVYGRRISDDEIKRFLCYGAGSRDIEMFKFAIMTRQELEKRRQAGASAEELAKVEVGDVELERRLKREKEDFLLRYPTLDFATEVGRAELSLELFRERLRQTMIFDKTFRPADPEEWPEISRAIIIENLGDQWIEDERISYATRLKNLFDQQKEWLSSHGFAPFMEKLATLVPGDSAATVEAMKDPQAKAALAALDEIGQGDIPADDPIAVEATRGTILQALNSYAIIHLDPDDIAANLPPAGSDAPADPAARAAKILMVVEGEPIYTEQVWTRIAPFTTPDQIEDAKRFLALIALLEKDLAEKGALITPAQYREWWPSTSKAGKVTYMEFLNQHDMLASQVLGFPSLWAFVNYKRIYDSFQKSIEADLAKDETLIPGLPVVNQIAGAAKLNVNVILISAFDFDHVQWKENGWEDAKRRALDLKKSLDEGAEWQPTLELNSEFWDPPMPEFGNKPIQNFYFKGTFGNQPQTRNTLLSYLMESEYRMFLYGPSATDHIFFEQKMGSIDGPLRGPKGYYIARITGKTPPTRPLDLKEPVHREIAMHYYLKNTLNARALSMLADGAKAGQVSGVTLGGGIKDL